MGAEKNDHREVVVNAVQRDFEIPDVGAQGTNVPTIASNPELTKGIARILQQYPDPQDRVIALDTMRGMVAHSLRDAKTITSIDIVWQRQLSILLTMADVSPLLNREVSTEPTTDLRQTQGEVAGQALKAATGGGE